MRFQNDTSLIAHPAAVINPKFYNLSIARLNLPTPRHVDVFSTILRKYDMREGLKAGLTVLRPSSDLGAQRSWKAPVAEKGSHNNGVSPIKIKLIGLTAWDPASTPILRANPIDPTNRLPRSLLSLREFLATTGSMVDPGNEGKIREYLGDYVIVLNKLHLQWGPRGNQKSRKPLKIDARELINKYQAYEWGTNIPLEEIHLERLGSMAKCSDGSAVPTTRIVDATFKLF